MASAEKSTKSTKSRKVSVWNWLGTLILLGIPVINIIAAILFIIFTKAQAKRSFCIAWLILLAVGLVLAFVAFLALPELVTALSNELRAAAGPVISLP